MGTVLLILGVSLTVSSAIGVIGSYRESSKLVYIYTHLEGSLILLLLIFTSIGYLVTLQAPVPSPCEAKPYELKDFSVFLQWRIKNWQKIKTCLHNKNTEFCRAESSYRTSHICNMASYSSIQLGCCKAFSSCNFTDLKPKSDCELWSQSRNGLCLDCESCKAGILDSMRMDMENAVTICAMFSVAFVLTFGAICCIIGSSNEENYLRRYLGALKRLLDGVKHLGKEVLAYLKIWSIKLLDGVKHLGKEVLAYLKICSIRSWNYLRRTRD